MTSSQWLVLLGLVFQVAGASLALFGFSMTWRRHHGSEPFWAPVIRMAHWVRDRAVAAGARVKLIVFRLLRRPVHRLVHAEDAAVAVDAALGLKVTRAPVPAELAALAKGLADLAAVVDLQREDNRIEHERMRSELADHSARLARTTRELAIGGLRLQVWGVLLITAGALLAGIPSLGAAQCP
ncbi:hypothetical protein [Kitasatospora sp. MY 5-36]|uniref:hypothetical protein n=1 Tax=Kitasatospora sp. MY 5-36 TaxID=1678027 RepID=UPI0006715BE9|nr:hypothetical protein [Kitasatospora sp. MY 5-36]